MSLSGKGKLKVDLQTLDYEQSRFFLSRGLFLSLRRTIRKNGTARSLYRPLNIPFLFSLQSRLISKHGCFTMLSNYKSNYSLQILHSFFRNITTTGKCFWFIINLHYKIISLVIFNYLRLLPATHDKKSHSSKTYQGGTVARLYIKKKDEK